MPKTTETIGQRIRNARGDRTRAELARAVGVDYATFWRWEKGELEPSAQSLPKLAAALGVTVGELFGEAA